MLPTTTTGHCSEEEREEEGKGERGGEKGERGRGERGEGERVGEEEVNQLYFKVIWLIHSLTGTCI